MNTFLHFLHASDGSLAFLGVFLAGLRLGIFPPVLTAAIGVLTTLFPCGGVLAIGNGDISGWAWVGERGWSRFGFEGGSGFGLSI